MAAIQKENTAPQHLAGQIQIAEKLGISLSGTKSRIQRGRQQLKDLLLNSCQIETDRFGNVTSCIC